MSAPHREVPIDAADTEEYEEITPEMIAAGAAELTFYVHHEVGPGLREELAVAVYEAMRKLRKRDLAR